MHGFKNCWDYLHTVTLKYDLILFMSFACCLLSCIFPRQEKLAKAMPWCRRQLYNCIMCIALDKQTKQTSVAKNSMHDNELCLFKRACSL